METFDLILHKIDEIKDYGFDRYMPSDLSLEFFKKMRSLRAVVKYMERELTLSQETQEQIEGMRDR